MPPKFPNRLSRPKTISGSPKALDIRGAMWRFKLPFTARTLVDGVFEGGGALGAGYIGALRALHDNNIWFARVAGNSAGSITAGMVAAGFNALEIQWLSSGFPGPTRPESLTRAGILEPIKFSKFLDLPSLSSVSNTSMKQTLLWNALKGTIIDEFGKISLPIRSRADLADRLLDVVLDVGLKGVPGLGDLTIRQLFNSIPGNQSGPVRDAIVSGLSAAGYPRNPPQIKDLAPIVEGSASLRTEFADAAWTAIARKMPAELLITNLLYEGSLFEGDFFLATLQALFGLKVHNNADAKVLFEDLKIPLAVIAADIDHGRMVVYSSKTSPRMEVAEAVRRSMSVPFVFQPRRDVGRAQGRAPAPTLATLVDGGICSNFPVWLFSAGGQNLVAQVGNDDARAKVGFVLKENLAAKSAWNVKPPKFTPTGQPPKVDDMTVLKPVLIEKLNELNLLPPGTQFPENTTEQHLIDMALLKEISGCMGIDKEDSTRDVITKGLMSGFTYFDVVLPLLGYHWLDFYVNEDEDDVVAMWDRGWHAAIDALGSAPSTGALPPLIANANTQQTPYPGA
jgi:predicted acylesterase/phospholipase RssA